MLKGLFNKMEEITLNGESDIEPIEVEIKLLRKDSPIICKKHDVEESTSNTSERSLFPQGSQIPTKYLEIVRQKEWFHVPLEEIDPFYLDKKSFIVIRRDGTLHRFSLENPLWIFSPFNPIRRLAMYYLVRKDFWLTSLILHILVFLPVIISPKLASAHILEMFLLSKFVFELSLKVVGRGVAFSEFAAFRDPWTWLDLISITLSFIGIAFDKPRLIITSWTLRMFKLIPLKREICNRFQEMISFAVKNVIPFFIFATPIVLMFTIMDTFYQDFHSQPLNNTFHVANLIANKELVKPKAFGWSLFRALGLLSQDGLSELFPKDLFPNITQNSIYYLMSFLLGTFPLGVFTYGLILGKFCEGLDSVDELVEKRQRPTSTTTDVQSVGVVITPETETTADPITHEPTCIETTIEKFNQCRTFLKEMISHDIFEMFITLIIVMNIFFYYCLDDYGLRHRVELNTFLTSANLYLERAYIIELIIKLAIIGPKQFYKSAKNKWDFWIISTIVLRLFISFLQAMQDSAHLDSYYFSTSYPMPIIMLRIVPRWESLYLLYKIAKKVLRDMKHFLAILALVFLVAFPFLGRGLFQEYFEGNFELFANQEVPRWNFGDFGHSVVSIFRIIYGEWTELFLNCWVVSSKEISGSFICFIFYLVVTSMTSVLLMYSTVFLVIGVLKRLQRVEESVQQEVVNGQEMDKRTGVLFSIKEHFHGLNNLINVTVPEIPHGNTDPESREDFIRKSGRRILDHDGFKFFSVLMISLGSLSLGLELKFRMISSHILLVFSLSLEMIFIIFLIVTFILRVTSFGFVKCLKTWPFICEFMLAIDALLTVCLSDYFSESFASHGVLFIRCFRAFLLINWISNLKATATTILKEVQFAYKSIFAVLFIWLFFDITCVKLLNGLYSKCIDPSNPSEVQNNRIIKNKDECLYNNYTWQNDYNNFDNVMRGMVSLIKVATLDGWTIVVESAVDSTLYDMQPYRDTSFVNHWIFIAFSTFGVLFLVCVIFGMFLYTMLRDKNGGLFLAEGQYQSYLNLKFKHKSVLTIDQPISALQCGTIGIVLLDFMSLAGQAYSSDLESESVNNGFQIVYHGCSVLLAIEILGKICHLRRNFIDCGWNILDLVLLVWSVTDFFVSGKINPIPRIFRLIHLYRFTPFYLLQFNNRMAIEKFIFSLKLSLPALKNLIGFFLINFYSFLILGISLFVNGYKYPNHKFGTFSSAFSILFKTSFFTGWSSVLKEMSEEDFENRQHKQSYYLLWDFYNDSQLKFALYFIIYMGITLLIVVNMYAVVVLEFGSQFSKRPQNFFNEVLKSTDYAVNEGDPPIEEVLEFSESRRNARSARTSQSQNQVGPVGELMIDKIEEAEDKIEVVDESKLEESKDEDGQVDSNV